MKNIEQTIISQYGNSPALTALIRNMNEYIRVDADIDGFFDTIWNVETAVGLGLDIWGSIVGLPTGRYIYTEPVTVLNDDQFRTLILIKALSNISITSSPSFNQMLNIFFAGRGRCYVSDQGSMQMRYTFEFPLEPWEIQVISEPDILLRPAGVGVTLAIIDYPVFGFSEANSPKFTGFNQAPFVSEAIVI
jgi:hypothetical protein